MTKTTISYSYLAERVGDAVLFNDHNKYNSEWWCGIYEQPLLREHLDAIDAENRQYALDRIADTVDASEKVKLEEELANDDENGEQASVLDSEIYQSYHITAQGAEYLLNHTAEIVSYDEDLDAYIWHIQHFGTSWSGVYTYVYDYSDEPEHEYIDISKADKYMIR